MHVLENHPCYNNGQSRYGRVHLPVAPNCNLKCNYCDQKIGCTHHAFRPSVATEILSPDEAVELVGKYADNEQLRVIGIAGPGEPLYNADTFKTLDKIHTAFPELILCLSTNGLLLEEYAETLKDLGVKACTITINCVDANIGAKIYSYVTYKDIRYEGIEGAQLLIEKQLKGLNKIVDQGVVTKINTILIPGINDVHIEEIAVEVKRRGAHLQNITPLIPLASFEDIRKPACSEIIDARNTCERIIPQFRHCKQCRADVIEVV
jgi:nitrogen fixation protein NifB